ncbi:hypothetical protein QL285_022654 [Trifolium repens]|nr:hypothetical protein QL285_022654 [Trifolium repens]
MFLLRVGSASVVFTLVSGGCWSLVFVSWFRRIRLWFSVLCSGFLVRRFMWLPVHRQPRFNSSMVEGGVIGVVAGSVRRLWCVVSRWWCCFTRCCNKGGSVLGFVFPPQRRSEFGGY